MIIMRAIVTAVIKTSLLQQPGQEKFKGFKIDLKCKANKLKFSNWLSEKTATLDQTDKWRASKQQKTGIHTSLCLGCS